MPKHASEKKETKAEESVDKLNASNSTNSSKKFE